MFTYFGIFFVMSAFLKCGFDLKKMTSCDPFAWVTLNNLDLLKPSFIFRFLQLIKLFLFSHYFPKPVNMENVRMFI